MWISGNVQVLTHEQRQSLAGETVRLLAASGLRVSTAESCTGGYVAKRITDIEGSSAVFEYGFVTYCNAAKQRLLGVKSETLLQFTEISPQTAMEMAEGAATASGSDIGLGITGLAGKGTAPEGMANGLVYLAVFSPWYKETVCLRMNPQSSREEVRSEGAYQGLALILKAGTCYQL